jgi:hypothetical protein
MRPGLRTRGPAAIRINLLLTLQPSDSTWWLDDRDGAQPDLETKG